MLQTYFKKYRFSLLAFAVLVGLQWFSVQFVKHHYRSTDVAAFKARYYFPLMTALSVGLLFVVFFYYKIYRKKQTEILKTFFAITAVCFVYSILLQDIIVGLLLGLNRCATTATQHQTYVVVAQKPQVILSALQSYDVITDPHFLQQHIRQDRNTLHVNDTLHLQFKKGILGVVYY